jgi:Tail fiber protein.
VPVIASFVYANIVGLDTGAQPPKSEVMPAANDIVEEQPVTQTGYVNDNQIVYSNILTVDKGGYDYNWVGLKTDDGTLFSVLYTPTQHKFKRDSQQSGDNQNWNFITEYTGIAELTQITIAAGSWQLDTTARMEKMDGYTTSHMQDLFGDGVFIGEGFKVYKDGVNHKVTVGVGYVKGLRVELESEVSFVAASLPGVVFIDVFYEYEGLERVIKFDVRNESVLPVDFVDANNLQHKLIKISDLEAGGSVTDSRAVIGINPLSVAPLKAHRTIEDAKNDVSLIVGQQVETACYSKSGFGGGDYLVVENNTGQVDGGLFHDTVNGLQLKLLHDGEITVDQFGAVPYEMDLSVWPSSGLGFFDSTAAINLAYKTGLTVEHSKGTYRATDELLITHANQKVRGKGAGALQLNFFAKKQGTSWNTRILFHGSPQKYTKSRRQSRQSSADPQDAPTATAINIEAEYVHLSGILIDLECDYEDMGQFNLGADYDHGVFSGTWTGVYLKNVHVRGYFRIASFYLDNTRLGIEHPFVTPGGFVYPVAKGVNNGTDKFRGDDLIACGGHKGLFIAGPKNGRPEYYYDEIAGELVPDSRGGFGTSDYLITQSFFAGPDHHTGIRRYDPPLNDEGNRIDPMKVDIDEAPGAYFYDSLPSRQSRRVKFDTCRFTTIEAIRIFIGNGLEMIFDNPVTESLSGTVYKTDGVTVINQYDYTLQSFKDIACYATEYDGEDTGARRVSFLQSGGNPNPNYFQNLVPSHYLTVVGESPSELQEKTYDCSWLNDNTDPISETITITTLEQAGFSMVQVVAEWTGLDVVDVSVATIAVKTGVLMKIGDVGVLRIDQELSSGLPFIDTSVDNGPYLLADDIYELRVDGNSSSSTRFQLYKNGIKQRYADGLLSNGRLVASGLTSTTGF